MAMEGGYAKCIKYVFVLFNFLFLLLGLCALGFGLWGRIVGIGVFDKEWFPNIDDDELKRHIATAFVWMIVGSVVLIGISFLGFFGGCKENRCLLFVFFVLVLLITFVFLAAIIIFYQYPDTMSKGLKLVLKKEKEEYEAKKEKVIENVDRMQKTLKCCLWNETEARERVINSCFEGAGNQTTIPATAKFHEKACSTELLTKIRQVIDAKQMYFVLIVIVTLIVCIFSMVLSMFICCRIKSESYQEMQ